MRHRLRLHPLAGYKFQFTDDLTWANDIIRCTLGVLKRKRYHGHTEFSGVSKGSKEAIIKFDVSMFLNQKNRRFHLVFRFHRDRMWVTFGNDKVWDDNDKFGKLSFRKGSLGKTKKEIVSRINHIYGVFKRYEDEKESEFVVEV